MFLLSFRCFFSFFFSSFFSILQYFFYSFFLLFSIRFYILINLEIFCFLLNFVLICFFFISNVIRIVSNEFLQYRFLLPTAPVFRILINLPNPRLSSDSFFLSIFGRDKQDNYLITISNALFIIQWYTPLFGEESVEYHFRESHLEILT